MAPPLSYTREFCDERGIMRPTLPALAGHARAAETRALRDWCFLPLNTVNCVNFALAVLLAMALAAPALARDSLGLFGAWAAFRDPGEPRCYAIAMAEPSLKRRDFQPYASVGTWPRRGVRGQLHIRLSRRTAPTARISLSIGGQRFQLTGGGGDAWATDRRMDAAIVAAMRSAPRMTVSARDERGNPFSNTWPLPGAATAMDAATIGCARLR